jgi:phosphotransferase system IIB component
MDNNIDRMLDDQKNIVELDLAIKKLKFQKVNGMNNESSLDDNVGRLFEDQKNIVELDLAIKKLKFKRKKKSYIKVFEA